MNFQKTPFSRTLSAFARRTAASAVTSRFVQFPGTIAAVNASATEVTVNFDVPGLNVPQSTMPVAMSKYLRFPLQVGDGGLAVTASAYLGTVSGLGSGSPAAAALQPNLSALVWVPMSNAAWASVSAQDFVATDATGASRLTLAPTGATLNTATIDTSGNLAATSLKAGNGASNTFTSQDGKTVTVVNGIITSIV